MAKTTDELRREQNELVKKRDQTTDAAEKKRLADQILAISDEITNRSLDAGRDAQVEVKGLEKRLDEERTRTNTDAVSAAMRGTRGIADEVGRRVGRDNDRHGGDE